MITSGATLALLSAFLFASFRWTLPERALVLGLCLSDLVFPLSSFILLSNFALDRFFVVTAYFGLGVAN
jgi:hypothetical protein